MVDLSEGGQSAIRMGLIVSKAQERVRRRGSQIIDRDERNVRP